MPEALTWQGSLLDDLTDGPRRSLGDATRHPLAEGAWYEVLRGWWPWPDDLFARLVEVADYRLRTMRMYDRVVVQPRLTAGWTTAELPRELDDLQAAARDLSRHHGVLFDRITTNLYRDGRDAVAWHGDRVLRDVDTSTVAILSLGASRAFRLRPHGGGPSIELHPAAGDLLVLGGTCQRTWQHCIPKVAQAGPRISVMFRHDVLPDGSPVPYRD